MQPLCAHCSSISSDVLPGTNPIDILRFIFGFCPRNPVFLVNGNQIFKYWQSVRTITPQIENKKMNMERNEGEDARNADFFERQEIMLKKMKELANLYDMPVFVVVYCPENGYTIASQTPNSNPDPIRISELEDEDEDDPFPGFFNMVKHDGHILEKVGALYKILKGQDTKNRNAIAHYLLSRAHARGVMEFNEEEHAIVDWFARRQMKRIKKRRARSQKNKNNPDEAEASQAGGGPSGDGDMKNSSNIDDPPVEVADPISNADNVGKPSSSGSKGLLD